MVYNYFGKVKRATHRSLFAAPGAGGGGGLLPPPPSDTPSCSLRSGELYGADSHPLPGQSWSSAFVFVAFGPGLSFLIHTAWLLLHSSTFPPNLGHSWRI